MAMQPDDKRRRVRSPQDALRIKVIELSTAAIASGVLKSTERLLPDSVRRNQLLVMDATRSLEDFNNTVGARRVMIDRDLAFVWRKDHVGCAAVLEE